MTSVSLAAALTALQLCAPLANANDKLIELRKSNENYVMPGRLIIMLIFLTARTRRSTRATSRICRRVAWSFSTGLLSGHEGAPLVVDGKMFIHTSFPNNTFALNLDDPTRILWQDKPKRSAAARAVACCDIVTRGFAYWPGDGYTPSLIIKTLLDGNVVALNAETGATYWKIENSDFKVGSTLTVAPCI